MIYLDDSMISDLGTNWADLIDVIRCAIVAMDNRDYKQPLKQYLRYGDPVNRIISMPAYLGGDVQKSGVKWIASFPKNIEAGMPRAHSVTILNDAWTGDIKGIINGAKISAIRTCAVSALIINEYLKVRPKRSLKVGICGCGIIGKEHISMLGSVLSDIEYEVFVFDKRELSLIDVPKNVVRASSWLEVYEGADIFITATASTERYVDIPPKYDSLLLNVSLRDFCLNVYEYIRRGIIVDNWDEVARENTDIEMMMVHKGLTGEETFSISEVISRDCIKTIDGPVMFNPMGMAIFDIAIANHFIDMAMKILPLNGEKAREPA